jgi:hypothetical protein
MDAIVQQFALIDALLSNWDAILIRMGPVSPALEQRLAQIATRLSAAKSPDEFSLIIDDLLETTMDTPAHDFVRDLVARSNADDSDSTDGMRGIVGRPVTDILAVRALKERTPEIGRNLGQAVATETIWSEVPVFFATNRKPFTGADSEQLYGGEPGPDLTYGMARVTIPVARHSIGKLETPAWWNLFPNKGDQQRYVVLHDLERLAVSELTERLAKAFQIDQSSDLLVFLHGLT